MPTSATTNPIQRYEASSRTITSTTHSGTRRATSAQSRHTRRGGSGIGGSFQKDRRAARTREV
jgi:hypothetical protein